MKDCQFGVSPVNYSDSDSDLIKVNVAGADLGFFEGGRGLQIYKGVCLLLFYLIFLKITNENEIIMTQREVEFIYEGRRKC